MYGILNITSCIVWSDRCRYIQSEGHGHFSLKDHESLLFSEVVIKVLTNNHQNGDHSSSLKICIFVHWTAKVYTSMYT